MIELKNVSFRYFSREEPTLRDISLSVKAGERLVIAGRTGCGKSTLLKLLNGLIPAYSKGDFSGRVKIAGLDTRLCKPEQLGMHVGTVYQSPEDQLFAMTVEDEVSFALENQGYDAAVIRSRVAETLQQVGLAGLETRSIHALSGGQKQRLALASVLVCRPGVLLLDEPLSQLNPQAVGELLELLLRLNQEYGVTLIVVEHRIHELYAFFPRLLLLNQGQIVYDGPTMKYWETVDNNPSYGLREPQCVQVSRDLGIRPVASDCSALSESLTGRYAFNVRHPASQAVRSSGQSGGITPIDIMQVGFSYPDSKQQALHDVSFSVAQGEAVAVMGRNGAGKSTLFNLLCGLTVPTRGQISLFGGTVRKNGHRLGFLRQEPDLMLLGQSVWSEVTWGKNRQEDFDRCEQLLTQLEMTEQKNDYPLALSKGQRLRVAFAALLAGSPELLLLDEPTSGQDFQSMLDIRRIIADYRQAGGTVLFCTHDVELAADIADRVLIFDEGRLIADGSPSDVFSRDEILARGGLTLPPMLELSRRLRFPPLLTVREVVDYVHAAAMGGS